MLGGEGGRVRGMRLRDFSPSPLHKTSALSSQLTLPWRPPLSQWVGVGNPKPDGCGLGGGRARATPKESSRTARVAARTARASPCARTKARPGGISYPEPRVNMTGLVPWTARGESVFWGRGGEQGKRRTTAVSENTATDAAQVDTPKSAGSGLLFSSVSRTHARPASPSVPPPGLILPTHTHPMVDSRRAELDADAALDAALDVGLRRLVYGTLAGLAAGAVLFRECSLGGWEGRWSAVERGAAMRDPTIPFFLNPHNRWPLHPWRRRRPGRRLWPGQRVRRLEARAARRFSAGAVGAGGGATAAASGREAGRVMCVYRGVWLTESV